MSNTDNERRAFEAWAKSKGYETLLHYKKEGYAYIDTNEAWQGWLARAEAEDKTDAAVAHLVEEVAKLISGAPFPSARSYAKAREVVDLLIAPPKEDGE